MDVIVVGGGPAGSVCATRLVQKGHKVVLFEKATFPRFHLGESLLPQSLPILEAIGMLPKLEASFIRKYGARFHDDITGRKERFAFEGAWRPEPDHAFEVPRDLFDLALLDHARATGVEVREQWTVEKILHEHGRAVGVEALAPDGTHHKLHARFVVDATGREALSARATGTTTKIEGLDQTALFAQFDGVPRQEGKLAGDIDIILFPSGDPSHPNWFWLIPFKDGRTSVGAVVSLAWMRDRRSKVGTDTTALFERAIAESVTATELLSPRADGSGATRRWPKAEATAEFSYRVATLTGPGWVAIGDAGGFIDPLFSTGAHLAMVGGFRAADAIDAAFAAPEKEHELLGAWETNLRAAAETFILAVTAFYRGPLVDMLFAEDKHTALRRSITSLLAGDVFGDAVWLRDARVRIKEMISPASSR